jgi:amino acid adenylation domain-containing protein
MSAASSMSSETCEYSFSTRLPKEEVICILGELHSAFTAVLNGNVLLIQSDASGTIAKTDMTSTQSGAGRRSSDDLEFGYVNSQLHNGSGQPRYLHAIVDVGTEYKSAIEGLGLESAVVVASNNELTWVTIHIDQPSAFVTALSATIETSVRAVAKLPSELRREKPQRDQAIRNALIDHPEPTAPRSDEKQDGFVTRFERWAINEPDRLAVVATDTEYTYGNLWKLACIFAQNLTRYSKGEALRIMVLPTKGVDLVALVIAAFKTGSVISIVDPRHPDQYIEDCAKLFRPTTVVDFVGKSPSIEGCCTLATEDLNSCAVSDEILRENTERFSADDCAIVTFTSGTTGIPKAVAGRYSSLTYFYDWMDQHFGPVTDYKFGMCSSIGHDPLQRDIMTPLYLGGSIVIPPADFYDGPASIGQWIHRSGINAICLNPILAGTLGSSGHILPGLKLCLLVGSALSRDQAIQIRDFAQNARIVNVYGSTETQRAVAYFEIPPEKEEIARLPVVIPVGRGMKDVSVNVLRPDGQRCLPFEVGEIAVCSSQISLGYLGNQELTSQRFTTDLPEPLGGIRTYLTGDSGFFTPNLGVIYVGRSDDQVKINGYRLELEEVNHACRTHPQVSEAVTIKIVVDHLPTLVTFLVPTDPALNFSPEGFKKYLVSRLPRYAVPHHVITRDQIPLTANQKSDLVTLRNEFLNSTTDISEDRLSTFVREHTGITSVPEDTALNLLGIDSLRFLSLVSQLLPNAATPGQVELNNSMTVQQIREAVNGFPVAKLRMTKAADKRLGKPTLYEVLGPITEISETEIVFGAKVFAHCCSNSYLALGTRVGRRRILMDFLSTGLPLHSHGSMEINSYTTFHRKLIDLLCQLHGTESALLFSSAYLAATTAIPAVAGPGDRIYIDESVHRSIVDGCQLSGAQIFLFRHNDIDHLDSILANSSNTDNRKFIITEGVFSVEGDIAPLPAIKKVATNHGCLVIVDEACSLGQLGKNGFGVAEHFNMDVAVDLRIGTFSKALASSGGYVAGSDEIINQVRPERGAAYSTGLSPLNAYVSYRMAEEFSRVGAQLSEQLRANGALWRTGLKNHGIDIGTSETAIVPIVCRSQEGVRNAHSNLVAAGLYGVPISPPWSTTMNAIRTSVTVAHNSADLERLVDSMVRALARSRSPHDCSPLTDYSGLSLAELEIR